MHTAFCYKWPELFTPSNCKVLEYIYSPTPSVREQLESITETLPTAKGTREDISKSATGNGNKGMNENSVTNFPNAVSNSLTNPQGMVSNPIIRRGVQNV